MKNNKTALHAEARIGLRSPRRLARKYMKRLLWPVAARLTPLVLWGFRQMSRESLHRFADGVAGLWFRLSPASRTLGIGNLDLVYGDELSSERKAEIFKQSIAGIIKSMLDTFYFSYHPDALAELVIIDSRTEKHLQQLNGRGAVILMAHLGNWELLMAVLRKYGMVSVVARGQKQFDDFVVNCRARYGVTTLHDNSSESQLITARLAAGEMVTTVLDRNVSHAKGVIALFMGKPAFTPYFPVNLADYGKAPVLPAFLIPEGMLYRLIVDEPIDVEVKGDRIDAYIQYSQEFVDVIGKYVRKYPQHWFWGHKRWHRPKGEVRGGLELWQQAQ